MTELELLWDTQCPVSESPIWDARRRRIWFCDIYGKRLLGYDVDTGGKHEWTLPEWIGSMGVCRSGRLVVALQQRVVLFDPADGSIRNLCVLTDAHPTARLNDGKVGPDGNFWVGSGDSAEPRKPIGAFYRFTPDGRATKFLDGMESSNGLAWSPDGRTMYHTGKIRGVLDAWDFDPATGTPSNRRTIADMRDKGRADGAAMDVEGNYWSAGVVSASLNVLAPAGALLKQIPVSLPHPTMPCFGETYIYITSMWRGHPEEERRKYPTLGGLHRMKAPVAGAEVGVFADV